MLSDEKHDARDVIGRFELDSDDNEDDEKHARSRDKQQVKSIVCVLHSRSRLTDCIYMYFISFTADTCRTRKPKAGR